MGPMFYEWYFRFTNGRIMYSIPNTKMQTTNLQHLNPNLAQGNHILVPHDGHADDPQEGGCSRLYPMVQYTNQ